MSGVFGRTNEISCWHAKSHPLTKNIIFKYSNEHYSWIILDTKAAMVVHTDQGTSMSHSCLNQSNLFSTQKTISIRYYRAGGGAVTWKGGMGTLGSQDPLFPPFPPFFWSPVEAWLSSLDLYFEQKYQILLKIWGIFSSLNLAQISVHKPSKCWKFSVP